MKVKSHPRKHIDTIDNSEIQSGSYSIDSGEEKHGISCIVSEALPEQDGFDRPRRLAELQEAEDLLFNYVWFHLDNYNFIAKQDGMVVEKEINARPAGAMSTDQHDEMVLALQTTQDAMQKYGVKNICPLDDFEWGVLNGKLLAIRWALGDPWHALGPQSYLEGDY